MGSDDVPNAISGCWFLSSHGLPADAAGGVFRAPGLLPAGSAAELLNAAWGQRAQLGALTAVADLRIDHGADLTAALAVEPQPADDAAALLLHAWQAWGPHCLPLVEGEFAFAIWDQDRRELVLARDALGQRPLHYRSFAQGLAFASTAATLAGMDGPMEPDVDRIASLLAFIPDFGPRTYLKHVERVMPGHLLRFDGKAPPRQEQWWKPRLHPVSITVQEGVRRMADEVDRAVGAALATDRAVVAAQLSGGHDSTLVVATAARLLPAGKGLLAITADSLGKKIFTAGSFDDADVARETAAMVPGVRHEVIHAGTESPLDAVDRWIGVDQPMLNPFNLGWLDLSFATARDAGADVMLVGISGNVTVSAWGVDRLSVLLKTGRWTTLLREMRAYRRHHPASWFGLVGMALGPWIPTRLWLWISKRRGRDASRFDERAFLRPDAVPVRAACRRASSLGLPIAYAPGRLIGSAARFAEMRWSDLGVVNHFIRARFGVEVRDPLGSRRVAELSLQLGPEHFYRDGQGRRLSRALLAGRAPEAVTSESIRRGLQGADWVEGAQKARPQMVRELDQLADDAELSAIFDVKRLREALDQWPDDGWDDGDQSESYRLLVAGIGACHWARLTRQRARGGMDE